MKNKFIFMLIFITGCATQVINSSEQNITHSCVPRLILGSGKNVESKYATARNIQSCDITIDLNESLNPTHQISAGNIKEIKRLSNIYEAKFSKIIFEHVGDGLMDLLDNGQDLDQLLILYRNMLAPEGKFIYESYRGATSKSWNDQDKILDLGIEDQIKKIFHAINTKFYNGTININNLEDKQAFVKAFYTMRFIKNGFTKIEVHIKTDRNYRKYHPAKTPYYYLEIIATLNNKSKASTSEEIYTYQNKAHMVEF